MTSIDEWAKSGPSGQNIDQWASAAPAAQPTPANAPGMLESGLIGFGQGVGNTALGIEQLAGKGLNAVGLNSAGNYLASDAASGLSQIKSGAAAAEAAHPYATGAGNLVGSTLATAPMAAMGPGGLITRGAIGGALSGAAQPVDPNSQDFWSQKLQQGVVGGAAGGAGAAVMGGLGRVLNPAPLNPAAADLTSRGVPLTPGQLMGGSANKLEQQMTSIPLVGNSIANARNRGIEAFNRAVYNDALAPIGQTVPDNVANGSAAVQHVYDTLGKQWDQLEQGAQFNYDGQLHRDITGIRTQLAGEGATPTAMQQFDNILRNNVIDKMDPNTGEMTGQQWGATRRSLNTIERNNTIGQPTADQSLLARAVGNLNDVVTANVTRNSPQALQPQLDAVSDAYARYKTLERAAGYTGARNSGNIFTPAQYNAAVGARSTAAQRAANTGLNAQLGQNAQQVLGTTVPDSGTAGRGWLTNLLLAPHLIAHPGIAAGGLAAGAAYSPTGIRALNAAMTSRPAAARALGNAIAPLALPTSAGAGATAGGALGGLLDYQ